MRRAVLIVLLVTAVAVPADAATTTVAVRNFSFSPDVVKDRVGGTVTWQNTTGTFHNVASTQGMFTSGNAAPAFTYTRTFSAGTFPYICEVHPTMRGRVRIRPRLSSAPDGARFTVRWAGDNTNTGSSFRVQYRVDGGAWKIWRRSTTADSGVFGRNGAPVTVRRGKTYGFRVRSQRNANTSSYSPIVSFTP